MKNHLVNAGRVIYLTIYVVGLITFAYGQPGPALGLIGTATPLLVAVEQWAQRPEPTKKSQ